MRNAKNLDLICCEGLWEHFTGATRKASRVGVRDRCSRKDEETDDDFWEGLWRGSGDGSRSPSQG